MNMNKKLSKQIAVLPPPYPFQVWVCPTKQKFLTKQKILIFASPSYPFLYHKTMPKKPQNSEHEIQKAVKGYHERKNPKIAPLAR